LVKDRTAAKNRAKIRTLALLKRQNAQRRRDRLPPSHSRRRQSVLPVRQRPLRRAP
jgi:hypothetical protein